MEGDRKPALYLPSIPSFQSTPSAWRETSLISTIPDGETLFQSTPSAWRETSTLIYTVLLSIFQSTPSAWRETGNISSRPAVRLFQSTPSAWRETFITCTHYTPIRYFNPLPPHGGRPDCSDNWDADQMDFNPLPPHGGRLLLCVPQLSRPFISIHSLRMEGDETTLNLRLSKSISIHSLRMEGDVSEKQQGND